VSSRLSGYVKLDRSLLTKQIFQNEKLLKVWIWCLLKANHKPATVLVGRQQADLKAGQFVFGRNKASEELNMAPSTVWDYMGILKKNQSIDIKSNNKFSVVTLVNWEIYQLNSTIADIKHDNKSTTNQQQINTNKNVKNDKKKKTYSDESKDAVSFLKTSLKEKGVTLARDWHLKSLPVAEVLIKQIGVDELTACIKWALKDKYWSAQVDSMSTIERALPKYQLAKQRAKEPYPEYGSVAHLVSAEEMAKAREEYANSLPPLAERIRKARQEVN
jgi:hypothetical protein